MTEPERQKKMVTYTVSMEREFLVNHGDQDTSVTAWQDIATVKVVAGTRRKTILLLALAETDVEVPEKPRLRALDSDSADVHEPTLRTQQEWVIG